MEKGWKAVYLVRAGREDEFRAEVTQAGLDAGWTPEKLKTLLAEITYEEMGIDENEDIDVGEIVVDGVVIAAVVVERQGPLCPSEVTLQEPKGSPKKKG